MKNKINKQNDCVRIKNQDAGKDRFKRYFLSVKISASLMLIFGLLVLSGCSKNDSELENSPCESRTGNIMSAKVNGDQICTDLGSALLIKTNATQLTIVGIFFPGIVCTSCETDEPSHLIEENGLSHEINNLISSDIFNILDSLGMPIHAGGNPANIEGTFLVSQPVLLSSNLNDDSVGYEFEGILQ